MSGPFQPPFNSAWGTAFPQSSQPLSGVKSATNTSSLTTLSFSTANFFGLDSQEAGTQGAFFLMLVAYTSSTAQGAKTVSGISGGPTWSKLSSVAQGGLTGTVNNIGLEVWYGYLAPASVANFSTTVTMTGTVQDITAQFFAWWTPLNSGDFFDTASILPVTAHNSSGTTLTIDTETAQTKATVFVATVNGSSISPNPLKGFTWDKYLSVNQSMGNGYILQGWENIAALNHETLPQTTLTLTNSTGRNGMLAISFALAGGPNSPAISIFPPGLVATSPTSLQVTWVNPTAGGTPADSYAIMYWPSGPYPAAAGSFVTGIPTNVNTWPITGLTPGALYDVTVYGCLDGYPSDFNASFSQIWMPTVAPSGVASTANVGTLVGLQPPKLGVTSLTCIETPPSNGDVNLNLRWSDDGGANWSNTIQQTMGATGQYATDIQFRRLGYARNRVVELSWSNDLATALTGMMIQYEIAGT